jgi:hypothetical protein
LSLRRVTVAILILLACAGITCADNEPQNLLKALATYPPRMHLRGYGPPQLSQVQPDASDSRAGVIGIATLMSGAGLPANAEIHYLVFATEDQATQYGTAFTQRADASGQQRLSFDFLSDATCDTNGQTQVCGIVRGIVFVSATVRGTQPTTLNQYGGAEKPLNAGNVLVFALKNLRRVSMVIGPLGEATPTPAPSVGPGPCELLSQSDAAAAMRSPVMPARYDPYTKTCYYNAQSPMAAGDGIGLQLMGGGRSKFDFDHQRISYTKSLSGVGDDAFEFVSVAGFVQVYVLKGSLYFVLTLTNRNDRNLARSAADLARQIASRLPG